VYIPSVKAAIRALTLAEARTMAEDVLKLPTATDVEEYAAKKILPRLKQAVPLLVEGSGTWTI
jgi:phosphoenolpyruvate-protein kinase (PTS system EI component)